MSRSYCVPIQVIHCSNVMRQHIYVWFFLVSMIGLQQKSFAKMFLLFPQLYIIVFLKEEDLKLPGFQWIREHQQK